MGKSVAERNRGVGTRSPPLLNGCDLGFVDSRKLSRWFAVKQASAMILWWFWPWESCTYLDGALCMHSLVRCLRETSGASHGAFVDGGLSESCWEAWRGTVWMNVHTILVQGCQGWTTRFYSTSKSSSNSKYLLSCLRASSTLSYFISLLIRRYIICGSPELLSVPSSNTLSMPSSLPHDPPFPIPLFPPHPRFPNNPYPLKHILQPGLQAMFKSASVCSSVHPGPQDMSASIDQYFLCGKRAIGPQNNCKFRHKQAHSWAWCFAYFSIFRSRLMRVLSPF